LKTQVTQQEKALAIIEHYDKCHIPKRLQPTTKHLLEIDEVALNLHFLRLMISKCPICKEQPIVIGGKTRLIKEPCYRAYCCNYSTESVKFDKLLTAWDNIKRSERSNK